MKEGPENKPYSVTFGIALAAMVFLIAVVFFSALSGKTPKTRANTAPTSTPGYSSKNSASAVSNPSGITVTNSMERRGDFLVVTTRVKNDRGYSVKKKLNVYVTDSTGVKRFVDMVYVELEGGEIGRVESSKKLSELGPPPHRVITEWKD